jgi:hypothetical protein
MFLYCRGWQHQVRWTLSLLAIPGATLMLVTLGAAAATDAAHEGYTVHGCK